MLSHAELLENEDIARVTLKPREYLQALLNDEKSSGRGAGLILTKEDILSIKRYERHSLDLPTSMTRVEQQLGFTKSGIPGLEPEDLLMTYLATNEHGRSWKDIEDSIKLSGTTIDLFAATFSNQGRQIIDVIDSMSISKRIDQNVANVTLEEIHNTPLLSLSKVDQDGCIELAEFLKDLASNIATHQQSSELLTQKIDTFSTRLSVDLIPDINDKVNLASRSDVDQQVKNLEADLEQLTVEIEQKNKEYKTAVNNIAWGIFGGPIGVAITGGIFGSQAEKIRKEKNRMINLKNQKILLLKEKRPLASAVFDLQRLFQDMNFRMLDAHKGATNLKDLWTMLTAYISSSANELAEIKDNHSLLRFAIKFNAVVTPWEEINGMTTKLLAIFDSALNQFQREQQSTIKGK
ncbi:Binary cytotoxin component [Pseudomonas coronafaciens pv. coronafaciens]|uniref:alpha-xenorhabdolysin family binary toxin subunit A n=1 Tax=Pseudomonas coronafaciens TaxID=53409 RepID=UPI000F002DBB|nr:alpha-xenorhabdolysin family binary toxin subunit A [Pseudomonas coronafaciens]RMN92082.1 Binary cytotoxin component [Pseudomonas coronafaciens pv. coronafaciens]